MKIPLLTKNNRIIACLIFPLALSPAVQAKKIELNPIDGVSLHEIMVELGTYRACMDKAQNMTSRGKNAYKKAQSLQCNTSFERLGQLMDKHSLKSIDKLSWQRWNKRDVGVGFSDDRILLNSSALISGVKNDE